MSIIETPVSTKNMEFILAVCSFAAASTLGLAGLSTQDRVWRATLVPLLFVFSSTAFFGTTSVPIPPKIARPIARAMGQFIIVWTTHISLMLTVEYAVQRPFNPFDRSDAYKMLFDVRRGYIRTWMAAPKSVQKQPGDNIKSTTHVTKSIDRAAFATKQLGRIAISVAMVYLLSGPFPRLFMQSINYLFPLTSHTNAPSPVFDRLTQELAPELLFRAAELCQSIFITKAEVDVFHSIGSIIFVYVLRLDEPAEWPAMYGDIRNTTTVRAFWGRYWHRMVSATWLSLASSVLKPLIGKAVDRRPGAMRSLSMIGMVFLFSGITHALVTWNQGSSCGGWDEIWFYQMQFAAIALESIVAKFMTGIIHIPPGLQSFAGYCWTWSYLLWTVPSLRHRKALCKNSRTFTI